MEQGEKSGDDLSVWASLTRNKPQVYALEVKLSAMKSEQSRDIDARPQKFGAASAELSKIFCDTDKIRATQCLQDTTKRIP